DEEEQKAAEQHRAAEERDGQGSRVDRARSASGRGGGPPGDGNLHGPDVRCKRDTAPRAGGGRQSARVRLQSRYLADGLGSPHPAGYFLGTTMAGSPAAWRRAWSAGRSTVEILAQRAITTAA